MFRTKLDCSLVQEDEQIALFFLHFFNACHLCIIDGGYNVRETILCTQYRETILDVSLLCVFRF